MRHENDFPGAGLDQVVGDAVAGAEVVDAHHVVDAPLRKMDDVADT